MLVADATPELEGVARVIVGVSTITRPGLAPPGVGLVVKAVMLVVVEPG